MKIKTARFGELEVTEQDLIYLDNGIIGFPEFKRAIMFEHQQNSAFRWLQSADDPDLAFVVIDPQMIVPNYPIKRLAKALVEDTPGAEPPADEEVAAAAIATIPPAPAPITVNLVAPVTFDITRRRGKQIVLHDTSLSTRHPLQKKKAPPKDDE